MYVRCRAIKNGIHHSASRQSRGSARGTDEEKEEMKATLVINMPKSCEECQFNYDMGFGCDALDECWAYGGDDKMGDKRRTNWCPLDREKNKAIPIDFIKSFSDKLIDRRERWLLDTLVEVWEKENEKEE